MLVLEMGRAFQGHRPADPGVRRVDLAALEAEGGEHVEFGIVQRVGVEAEPVDAEILAQGPFVEDELDVERLGEGVIDPVEHDVGEADVMQRGMVDRRRIFQGAVADA